MRDRKSRIAIIGGGINGLCIGWELAKAGHEVVIFERDTIVAHTSSASSKLLHGGLRYLENGEFRLVREALRERQAWFQRAPHLAKPLQLTLPIYDRSRRRRHLVGIGLRLYDWLAGTNSTARHQWLDRPTTIARHPQLKTDGLRGAFQFWDGQMDDRSLGRWVAEQSGLAGAVIHEQAPVTCIDTAGNLSLASGAEYAFDQIINAAGPWSRHLLRRNAIPSRYDLDLVRGSHIVLNKPCVAAYLLEAENSRRLFFVLPWQQGTLVGTTEVRETYADGTEPKAPAPSVEEIDYLLAAYHHYFTETVAAADLRETFAGLRPLVKSAADPSRATREYVLERRGQLITVFGGKWTTACALARKVRHLVEAPH